MGKRQRKLIFVLLMVAASVFGQTATVTVNQTTKVTQPPVGVLTLDGAASFVITRGSGSPNSVITATTGSMYLDTTGAVWFKQTGTGNTGWTQLGAGAVTSVFGRTGAVVAAANDYNFNQLAGTAATTQGGLPVGGTTGQTLQKNSATNYDTGWITQTTTSESIWNYKNVVTMADPATGNVRVNNAAFGSVTQMAISKNDGNGTDRTPLLASLQIGDIIEVQDQTTAANWARYNISAAVVNNTTWFQIPIAFVTGSGSNPANNDNLLLTFNTSGGGGGAGVVSSVFGRTGAVVATSGDYGFSLISGILGATQHPALTGDVTTPSGSVATTISNNAVTYAKMQNVSADVLLGRGSAPGIPQEITLGTALGISGTTLSAENMVASGTLHAAGLAPDPGSTAGTTKFLREDATWVVPAGGGGTPGGANTNVQFNNSGAFGGDAGFTYASKIVNVGNGTNLGGITMNAGGSTTSSPMLLGISTWASPNASRWEFGDYANCFQAEYGGRLQWTGYWGLEIYGSRQTASTLPFNFGSAGDPGVNIIGTQPGNNVLAVTGAASETGTLQEWRNSSGSPLAHNYNGSFYTNSSGLYAFSSGAASNVAIDTALARNAAGVVEVDNGTAGTFADIKVRTTIHNGYTVATLPTAVAGMTAYVTDGAAALAWGATVTGGASTHYLCWYNGTNWTVVGK